MPEQESLSKTVGYLTTKSIGLTLCFPRNQFGLWKNLAGEEVPIPNRKFKNGKLILNPDKIEDQPYLQLKKGKVLVERVRSFGEWFRKMSDSELNLALKIDPDKEIREIIAKDPEDEIPMPKETTSVAEVVTVDVSGDLSDKDKELLLELQGRSKIAALPWEKYYNTLCEVQRRFNVRGIPFAHLNKEEFKKKLRLRVNLFLEALEDAGLMKVVNDEIVKKELINK